MLLCCVCGMLTGEMMFVSTLNVLPFFAGFKHEPSDAELIEKPMRQFL